MAAGVKERKDKSLEKIFACIDNKESFLLDAGAGSGKTLSLIKTLEYVINKKGKKLNRLAKKIGCITYTNAAVDEIKERYGENKVLVVNTIHKFFWSIISDYQQELKEIMVELYDEIKKVDDLKNLRIQYKEFKRISEGIISHDEVIKLSWEIFANYPKLKKIFMDRFPVVLIDEYQDTHQEIVNIFLSLIAVAENKDFTVGFFGDFMQSIYEKRTGRITDQDNLQHISKETNFRSAPEVIDLLNNIRIDIKQYPAGKNKKIEGSASFIYLDGEMQDSNDICDKMQKKLAGEWSSDLKVFFLTHTKIAEKAGFKKLLGLYDGYYKYYQRKEKLFERNCPVISFLIDRVELSVDYYQENKIFNLMDNIDFEFLSGSDKLKLKKIMDELIEIRENGKPKDIWNYVFEKNLFVKDDKIMEFIEGFTEDEKRESFYNGMMDLSYSEIINFYHHNEKEALFSTQHNTKGQEYENVLLVIGERRWNSYNFPEYLTGDIDDLKESIYDRTHKLFYVSCSRAIKNLVIIYLTEKDSAGLTRVEEWFGEDNVFSVSEFMEGEVEG